MMRGLGRVVSLGLVALLGAACDLSTEPPAPPAPTGPYVLSTRGVRLFGELRLPVLLARFSNSPEPQWSRLDVMQRMFGGADGGLVNLPFHLASAGRFRIVPQVSPWLQTSVPTTGNLNQYAAEAVMAADPHFDFGRFDNDGPDGYPNSGDDDGVVDGGIVLLHSGLDRTCYTTGTTADAGPHPFANLNFTNALLQPYPTGDARRGGGYIVINAYTLLSVQHCSGTATNSTVLSHELGHLLFELPDLYHQVPGVVVASHERWRGRRWVVGCWDLMAAGSWGCGAGQPPKAPEVATTLGAWGRVSLGWEQPIIASPSLDTVYTLSPISRGQSVLKIEVTPSEYFLVEFRILQRGDAGIPSNGVLIHHVNEAFPRVPATADEPRRYRVSLVEADDDSALVRIDAEGGNRGVGADAFGTTVTEFGPGQHSRASTLAGVPLPFRLTEISFNLATGQASLRLLRDP